MAIFTLQVANRSAFVVDQQYILLFLPEIFLIILIFIFKPMLYLIDPHHICTYAITYKSLKLTYINIFSIAISIIYGSIMLRTLYQAFSWFYIIIANDTILYVLSIRIFLILNNH